ncbi:hypothetical protein AB0M22_37915 [Nocardia sp. NPDC051756]|uniref:hypothetical protein n=1 Tax=Nocardia sp. NPDC051756 TaxID=3154751 RepID=UPI0034190FA9
MQAAFEQGFDRVDPTIAWRGDRSQAGTRAVEATAPTLIAEIRQAFAAIPGALTMPA